MGACVSIGDDNSGTVRGESKYLAHAQSREAQALLQGERRRDEALALLTSRMVAAGALKCSILHTQQGRKGVNQDAMVVWEEYMSQEDAVFCGVFDGHGPYGHLVAKRVRDSLPSLLADTFVTLSARAADVRSPDEPSSREENDSGALAGRESFSAGSEEWLGRWHEAHLQSYRTMDSKLEGHPVIDCFCSGTTSVTLVKMGRHVIASNVGDSRCIIGRRTSNGGSEALQMTIDLKPDLPAEAARIRQCRGRVFAMRDEPEVQRVWLPHDDSPGLAMARAFGDICLKSYGVISEPKFYYHELDSNDLFALLATDGVWDVLSNQEVVEIVRSSPRDRAARAVVEKANANWRIKFPLSKTDDCAVVCLFFDDVTGRPKGERPVSRVQEVAVIPRVGSNESNESTSVSISTPGDTVLDFSPSDSDSLSAGSTVRAQSREAFLANLTGKLTEKTLPGNKISARGPPEESGMSAEEWVEKNKFSRANSFANLSKRDRSTSSGA